jgi:hypothetical protein
MWRIFARHVWDPDLASVARRPAPGVRDFAARQAIADAQTSLHAIEAVLWPQED